MAQLPDHLAANPVGRERLSREALAGHQRARILDAATGVFAKRGYTETTIDNIVAAAKASVGSFYGLFDGKEECFLATYDRIVASTRKQIATAVAEADGWAEQTYLGLRELLEIFAAAPLEARIALIEVQTAGSAGTARYNTVMDEVINWLRRGREAYPVAADLPVTYEQAAVAGFAFFLQQRLLSAEPLAAKALLTETAQMVIEPIAGTAEVKRLSGLSGTRS